MQTCDSQMRIIAKYKELMKKGIIDRAGKLGGNVANLKGDSLKENLCAITFDTALFLKPVDTPWFAAEDTELIEALGDWVDEHMELFNFNSELFYKEMTDTFFTLVEEPRRQLFWIARPFTPFKKVTPDFVELLYTDDYPNNYYICLSGYRPGGSCRMEYGS